MSLDSYPVLAQKNWGYAGGAEVEQVDLGRELVKRGHKVIFITYYNGGSNVEEVNGLKVIKTYSRHQALRLSPYKKFKTIWSSLKEAQADVYFQESGATGVLPYFCSFYRKKFIYRIPSDAMVVGKSLGRSTGNIERFIQRFIDFIDIKKANTIVAQNQFQKLMLKKRFKKDSVIIKNGVNLPLFSGSKRIIPTVIWVGRITWVKQPEIFVRLAKKIPYTRFQIIGGATVGEAELYNQIKSEASKISNLDFIGFVPYHRINEYFEKATLLVNTSVIEAFPITFIQAWANNTPVLSLKVDPDDILRKEEAGLRSGSIEQLVFDTELLLKDYNLRETMGRNGCQYVFREHNIQKVADNYLSIF